MTAWRPTPMSTPKAQVPHRSRAARALVALIQLGQVEDNEEACNAMFAWLCQMPLDDLEAYCEAVEESVRKMGKESFGQVVEAIAKQGQLKLGRSA